MASKPTLPSLNSPAKHTESLSARLRGITGEAKIEKKAESGNQPVSLSNVDEICLNLINQGQYNDALRYVSRVQDLLDQIAVRIREKTGPARTGAKVAKPRLNRAKKKLEGALMFQGGQDGETPEASPRDEESRKANPKRPVRPLLTESPSTVARPIAAEETSTSPSLLKGSPSKEKDPELRRIVQGDPTAALLQGRAMGYGIDVLAEEWRRKAEQREFRMKMAEKKLKDREKLIKDLRLKLRDADAEINMTREQVRRKESQCSNLRAAVKVMERTCQRVQAEAELKKVMEATVDDQLRNELAEKVCTVDMMENTLNRREEKIRALEIKIRQLEETIGRLQIQLRADEDALHKAGDEADRNRRRNDVKNSNITRLESEVRMLRDEAERNEDEVAAARAMLRASEENCERMKCERDTALEQLKAAHVSLRNQVEETEEVRKINAELDQSTLVEELKVQLADAKEEINRLREVKEKTAEECVKVLQQFSSYTKTTAPAASSKPDGASKASVDGDAPTGRVESILSRLLDVGDHVHDAGVDALTMTTESALHVCRATGEANGMKLVRQIGAKLERHFDTCAERYAYGAGILRRLLGSADGSSQTAGIKCNEMKTDFQKEKIRIFVEIDETIRAIRSMEASVTCDASLLEKLHSLIHCIRNSERDIREIETQTRRSLGEKETEVRFIKQKVTILVDQYHENKRRGPKRDRRGNVAKSFHVLGPTPPAFLHLNTSETSVSTDLPIPQDGLRGPEDSDDDEPAVAASDAGDDDVGGKAHENDGGEKWAMLTPRGAMHRAKKPKRRKFTEDGIPLPAPYPPPAHAILAASLMVDSYVRGSRMNTNGEGGYDASIDVKSDQTVRSGACCQFVPSVSHPMSVLSYVFPPALADVVRAGKEDDDPVEAIAPATEDVVRQARVLGIDVAADVELLWLAEESLCAPIPVGWQIRFHKDYAFFHHPETGESSWHHPFQAHYVELVKTLMRIDASLRSALRLLAIGTPTLTQNKSLATGITGKVNDAFGHLPGSYSRTEVLLRTKARQLCEERSRVLEVHSRVVYSAALDRRYVPLAARNIAISALDKALPSAQALEPISSFVITETTADVSPLSPHPQSQAQMPKGASMRSTSRAAPGKDGAGAGAGAGSGAGSGSGAGVSGNKGSSVGKGPARRSNPSPSPLLKKPANSNGGGGPASKARGQGLAGGSRASGASSAGAADHNPKGSKGRGGKNDVAASQGPGGSPSPRSAVHSEVDDCVASDADACSVASSIIDEVQD
eukprot:Rmarinus@m.12168